MRDKTRFQADALKAMQAAAHEAAGAPGPEEAISAITRAEHELLGDRDAWRRPGALLEGEKDQYASGGLFLLPGGDRHVLIGPHNYGPEQTHMVFSSELGHPGVVVKTRQPLMLENTDEHKSFVKILATFRAGSVVFCPVIWKGEFHGLLACAAQARGAMSADDLEVHRGFADLAAAAWVAHGGPQFVKQFA